MSYVDLNIALGVFYLIAEFSLMDRLIQNSSIFSIQGIDSSYIDSRIRKHRGILFRSAPVLCGAVLCNVLLAQGLDPFIVALASFPFLSIYIVLTVAEYFRQLKQIRRDLARVPEEGPA